MRRFKNVRLLALLLLAALLLIRCGTENPFQPTRGDNEVWIQAAGFDPKELTVTAGTTVTWTNKDATDHDVTSGTPGNFTTAFQSSPLPLHQGETHSATFSKSGRFPYYCQKHTSKVGTIVVQ
ncbi:cupredoxin domain-containing protein [candidate division KSB1 bacterium]|nr:cupredoxin domain-containing protein [candidate division KSB1 bacterium]